MQKVPFLGRVFRVIQARVLHVCLPFAQSFLLPQHNGKKVRSVLVLGSSGKKGPEKVIKWQRPNSGWSIAGQMKNDAVGICQTPCIYGTEGGALPIGKHTAGYRGMVDSTSD